MADIGLTESSEVTVASSDGGNKLIVNSDGSVNERVYDGAGAAISSLSDGNGGNALEVAQSATGFDFDSGNSSTVQLTAGATFTGTVTQIINQQASSILITADQPGTLVLNQFIDAAGLRLCQQLTYAITAGVGFSRSGVINGNYLQVVYTNNGASSTTTLNINTYYGTIPASTQLDNQAISLSEINGTSLTAGQKTSALSIPVVVASNQSAIPVSTESAKLSYSAGFTNVILVAATTDCFTITGSATKTIRITRIGFGCTTTAGSGFALNLSLIKRSTADTLGVSTTAVLVPHDSTNAAGTAVIRSYTANPVLGTSVGNVYTDRFQITAAGSVSNKLDLAYGIRPTQTIVLRGVAEQLCLNLGGAVITGPIACFSVEWTEE